MELVKREDNFSASLAEIQNTKKMCEMLMQTPHYAKMGPEGIYAVVAKAKSMDIDPMDALNGALYFVNGRVGMSTEAMAARMRAAGHSIQKDIQKSTNTCCVLIGKRADNGDQWVTSFSVEDAKRAGIYNERGPWGKYPDVMCYNRAMSKMFRQLTPDLSKGAGYTLDELKEISGNDPIAEASVVVSDPLNEKVTEEQAEELAAVFQNCDPVYLEKVWNTLRRQPHNVNELGDLTVALYNRIMTASIRNADSYQQRLKLESEHIVDEDSPQEVMEA